MKVILSRSFSQEICPSDGRSHHIAAAVHAKTPGPARFVWGRGWLERFQGFRVSNLGFRVWVCEWFKIRRFMVQEFMVKDQNRLCSWMPNSRVKVSGNN